MWSCIGCDVLRLDFHLPVPQPERCTILVSVCVCVYVADVSPLLGMPDIPVVGDTSHSILTTVQTKPRGTALKNQYRHPHWACSDACLCLQYQSSTHWYHSYMYTCMYAPWRHSCSLVSSSWRRQTGCGDWSTDLALPWRKEGMSWVVVMKCGVWGRKGDLEPVIAHSWHVYIIFFTWNIWSTMCIFLLST